MDNKKITAFLDFFSDHVYRFIDQTGAARPPVSSKTYREDLNTLGYEAYFTVNGFKEVPDAKRENCTSLNSFFIDIDGRKDEAEIERIKQILEPTCITETMRGYHIYWLLDEPLYKEDVTPDEWDLITHEWEQVEQSIVTKLNADPVVKDIPRILRVPGSYYWKKTGELYKGGVDKAPFKITILHENKGARYSMQTVTQAFPQDSSILSAPVVSDRSKEQAENEKADFFQRVEKAYPIEDRPSFKSLITGKSGTLPSDTPSRNGALLVVASLMRRAGWTQLEAVAHVQTTGWHGIESERGGDVEIANTIASAYRGGYNYSKKHPIIEHNTTVEEQRSLTQAYMLALKARKETDQVRYSVYEQELLKKFPHLKKNDVGMLFNYEGGVYKPVKDEAVSSMILSGMYEDMLWGYRTRKSVLDKIACLLSIIPMFELTEDHGRIVNLANGLLDIITRELKPHTPMFMSLAQSPVLFDKYAQATTWERCVKTWMEGEEADNKTEVLQQYAGYCLTSSTKYAKMLFLVGDGGNGKSTFADTIRMVVGRQATSNIDLEDLSKQFGLEGLMGKRLNIVEEVSGNFYHSHILKKLVSGEEVTISIKYKPQFTFTPQAKFIFAVNQMPRVDDSSMASERRILTVHFKNSFRNNTDTTLRSKDGSLAKELSGVLNWMLEGVTRLKNNNGFITTKEQILALKEYREENSSVEGFIAECIIVNEGNTEDTADIYDEYIKFCNKEGRKYKSKISMVRELKAHGDRNSTFSYIGRANGHDLAKFEGLEINKDWEGVTKFRSSI